MSQQPPNGLFCEDCPYKKRAERNAMVVLPSASTNTGSPKLAGDIDLAVLAIESGDADCAVEILRRVASQLRAGA